MKKRECRLVLYGFDFGRPARNIWMMSELSIDFELINDALPFDMSRLNPNDRVPFLHDKKTGLNMFESLAINVWIVQNYKDLMTTSYKSELVPRNVHEMGIFLKWSFWAMTELDMLLFEGLMHNPNSSHIISRKRNYEGYFDREKTTKRGDRILRELEFPLNVLENELKRTKWLGGDHFTVTDLNVASVAYWIHFQGQKRRDRILENLPHTKDWLDRCMKRPHSPLSVLSKTSVGKWNWDVLQEGASKRSSRAGEVSFTAASKL